MIIALWMLALFLLGLWSFAAWGLHAVLTIDPTKLSDLKPLIDQIPYGDLIDQWIPGWQDLLRASVDLCQWVLGWVGGAAPIIVWVVWGLGTLAVLAVTVSLNLLISLTRRKSPSAAAA